VTVGPTPVTVINAPPRGTIVAPSGIAEGTSFDIDVIGLNDPSSADVRAGLRFGFDLDNDGEYEVGGGTYETGTRTPGVTIPAGELDGPELRTIRVVIIDKDGGIATRTQLLNVNNIPPTGTLNVPAAAAEDEPVPVSLSDVDDRSDADRSAGIRFGYDFDNDGDYEVGGGTYDSATEADSATIPAGELDGPGAHTVRVVMIDKDGSTATRTATIDVTNTAPTASLADATTSEGTPAELRFEDLADVAADLDDLTFEWDVDGDGTFEPGGRSVEVPAPDGPATITVRGAVLDGDGGRSEYEATVTVDNAAPTASLVAPDTVPASGETAVRVRLADPGDDELTGTLEWGDGTSAEIAGAGEHELTHTYGGPGERTLRLRATDSDGDESEVVTHRLVVAAPLPQAPPEPSPPPPATAEPAAEPAQAITGASVSPRCLRANDLRARIARTQTMKVRFTLREDAPVRIRLQRLKGKCGATKCPPPRGVPKRNGRRVPGVYRPFTSKALNLRAGTNTLTVAATGRKGKRLAPGTYLLLIRAGDTTARTKLWVLR